MSNVDPKPAGQTYAAVLKCGNCGKISVVAVPRGVTTAEYAGERACPDCGCKTMRPRWGTE